MSLARELYFSVTFTEEWGDLYKGRGIESQFEAKLVVGLLYSTQ